MSRADDSMPIVLAPVRATRIGSVVGGIVLAVIGAALVLTGALSSTLSAWLWIAFAMGVALIPYGLVIAIRAPRLSITLTDDSATVRGYLSTVTIPRRDIVGLSSYPSLLWTDLSGRRHKTAVNALNVYRRGRVLPEILQQIDGMTAVLATWIDGRTQG